MLLLLQLENKILKWNIFKIPAQYFHHCLYSFLAWRIPTQFIGNDTIVLNIKLDAHLTDIGNIVCSKNKKLNHSCSVYNWKRKFYYNDGWFYFLFEHFNTRGDATEITYYMLHSVFTNYEDIFEVIRLVYHKRPDKNI